MKVYLVRVSSEADEKYAEQLLRALAEGCHDNCVIEEARPLPKRRKRRGSDS